MQVPRRQVFGFGGSPRSTKMGRHTTGPARPYTQLMRAQDDDTDAVVTRLNDRTATDDELLSTELNLDPVAQDVFERRTVHGTGNGEGSGS